MLLAVWLLRNNHCVLQDWLPENLWNLHLIDSSCQLLTLDFQNIWQRQGKHLWSPVLISGAKTKTWRIRLIMMIPIIIYSLRTTLPLTMRQDHTHGLATTRKEPQSLRLSMPTPLNLEGTRMPDTHVMPKCYITIC
jgi:hypothetical protein